MNFSLFEVIMLSCFGLAWPASIYRSYKSKSNVGKSFSFLCIILAGYIAGILHKIFYLYDIVIWAYVVNGIMVMIDMILFMRNKGKKISKPI